jgi:hypothetical protein
VRTRARDAASSFHLPSPFSSGDLMILVLIIYSAITVPLRVCFDASAIGFMWRLEVSMSIVLLLDIFLTFITAIFDSRDGKWMTDKKEISRRYLKGW